MLKNAWFFSGLKIMGKQDRYLRLETGFTLLEALIAMVLMIVGFAVLLQAIGAGLSAGSENENDLLAVNLAQEKIEGLRNAAYLDIINETKKEVPNFSVFWREVIVQALEPCLKQVMVNVYWFSKGSELSQSAVTYIAKTRQ